MGSSSSYEGIRLEAGTETRVDDPLTVEEALQININGDPYTVIMRTPGSETEMTLGLLHTEDLYRGDPIPVEPVTTNELGHITEVNVNIAEDKLGKGYLNSRSMLSVSSCGICGKRELGDLKVEGEQIRTDVSVSAAGVAEMYARMEEAQATFNKTGGSHGAAAFNDQGQLLAIKEDIGRHNAVDKVIGGLIVNSCLKDAKFLLVSGRISYEIVTKAFMAGIPVLAAVSAPSTLAVDFAKELGITLLGFTRNGKTTCYAHPERVRTE